jgi:hypothetical protein
MIHETKTASQVKNIVLSTSGICAIALPSSPEPVNFSSLTAQTRLRRG